jgi:predicted protein tyrosine phosphatase
MICVCSLREMPQHVRILRPHCVISLVAPEEQPPTPADLPADRHLRIDVHDVCAPCAGAIVPCAAHVRAVLAGLASWPGKPPILIHCVAGISRSMAVALIVAANKWPGRELDLARALRRAAPHAQPNRLMVELGDAILGCQGRLIRALDAMGPAVVTDCAPLVCFPLVNGDATIPPIVQPRLP